MPRQYGGHSFCNLMGRPGLRYGACRSSGTHPDQDFADYSAIAGSGTPHTVHAGSLFNLTERHSIDEASRIRKRPFSVSPISSRIFNVSAACTQPIIPTRGANTPITAQRISSFPPFAG